MISYVYKKGAIFVHVDGQRAGTILSVMKDNRYHYTYYPIFGNDHGEVFPTIKAVKNNLEAIHNPVIA